MSFEKTCIDCGKKVHARGYCNNHYHIHKKEGLFGGKKCKVCIDGKQCDEVVYGNGFCNIHYQQMRVYGKILERTNFDNNEIIVKGDTAIIFLYNQKNEKIAEAIIDFKNIDKIKKYKWHCFDVREIKYVRSYEVGFLHNFLMNTKPNTIDHKDGNGLNNLESNLRNCTLSQNMMNKKVYKNNTSGVKGVYWSKIEKKWKVEISKNKKKINLGYYNNKEDAVKVRQDAEKKYFGEFSYLNRRGVEDYKESA